MKEIFEIIENLRNLSGNEQLDYLRSHKDNELLKEVLQFTYNPHLIYKISEAKLDKALGKMILTSGFTNKDFISIDKSIWDNYKNDLLKFNSKKGLSDADIDKFVAKYFTHVEPKSEDFLQGVLLKDLRINMGIISFSKVWNDFIFNNNQVQLANKFTGKNFNNPYYSRKFDGKRLYILDGEPYSRTNKKCSTQPIKHILDEFKKIINIDNVVLDGENLYFDEDGKEDFQKGISLTSRDERLEGCENICYVIFDVIPKKNFVEKTPFIPFSKEYEMILDLLADYNKPTPCYSLIGTKLNNVYIARQDQDMKKLSELREKNNWEGLMVRNGDAPYEYKRTMSLLKIKKMQDSEFDIVGFEKGTGKYDGVLGSVIVKLPTGENVSVGSGFDDNDREWIWNNREKILNSGYQLKVQYFENTKDKNGNNSLRFPVFKAFRKDGIETMRIE